MHYKTALFLITLLFGVYYINLGIHFYPMPDAVLEYSDLINTIAGGLLIIGGIHFLGKNHKHHRKTQ